MSDLRLEGITKRFGAFVANQNTSLSIKAGTIYALLGENGAGKSTLMNILCGFYQPDAGHRSRSQVATLLTPLLSAKHCHGVRMMSFKGYVLDG